jgi:hypothetical protein
VFTHIPKSIIRIDTATLRDVPITKGLEGWVIPFLDDAGHPLDAELLGILTRRKTLGPFAYIWGDWETGKKVSAFSPTWGQGTYQSGTKLPRAGLSPRRAGLENCLIG